MLASHAISSSSDVRTTKAQSSTWDIAIERRVAMQSVQRWKNVLGQHTDREKHTVDESRISRIASFHSNSW